MDVTLLFLELSERVVDGVGDVRAAGVEVVHRHVLRALVHAEEFGREVHSPARAPLGRQVGTMNASDSNLAGENGE